MVPTRLRILYGDTDRMGVVYYANYLRFFEAGRNELIRARGLTYRHVEEQGLMLPVVEVSANYHRPAVYDDLIRVETSIGEVRRASVRFDYRVVRDGDGELLVDGSTVHACIDRSMKPVRFPEELRELLARAD